MTGLHVSRLAYRCHMWIIDDVIGIWVSSGVLMTEGSYRFHDRSICDSTAI